MVPTNYLFPNHSDLQIYKTYFLREKFAYQKIL